MCRFDFDFSTVIIPTETYCFSTILCSFQWNKQKQCGTTQPFRFDSTAATTNYQFVNLYVRTFIYSHTRFFFFFMVQPHCALFFFLQDSDAFFGFYCKRGEGEITISHAESKKTQQNPTKKKPRLRNPLSKQRHESLFFVTVWLPSVSHIGNYSCRILLRFSDSAACERGWKKIILSSLLPPFFGGILLRFLDSTATMPKNTILVSISSFTAESKNAS